MGTLKQRKGWRKSTLTTPAAALTCPRPRTAARLLETKAHSRKRKRKKRRKRKGGSMWLDVLKARRRRWRSASNLGWVTPGAAGN